MPASEQEWQDFRDRAARAASKGAALLDREKPEWFRKVDTYHLEMQYCHKCVLGQVFADYNRGLEAIDLEEFDVNGLDDSHYGFALNEYDDAYFGLSAWMELGRAWRMEIQKREKGHV